MSATAENVANYESTTLPQLPSAWRWVKFADICERVSVGHVGPTTKYFTGEENGIPLIRSQNVRPGKLEMDDVAYIVPEFHEKLKKSQLMAGDVLIVRVGANRSDCCVVPDNISNVNCANIVFARPKFNGKFFSYYFQTHFGRKMLLGATTGAAQEVINTASVASMPVPLPPENVHERISLIISSYDDLIENNKRRIELLEESARQLYKEWFVRFRFPGHEHVKIIDGVPEGWESLELQDVCERITDGAHHSPKGVEDGLPMASVKDMHSWGIDLKTCRKISFDDFEKLERGDCRPKQGDVLIAKDGSYLKHVFVAEDNAPYVLLSSIAILRPNDRIKSNQLAMFLGLPQTKKRLTGYVSGVALPRIILKEFRKFTFICPPIKLQDMWAENYDCIFDLCRTLIKENEKLAEARNLLLPKLMNGGIAV